MAKAIYLQEYREDYMYIHFFRNPKALEAKKNELLQDATFVKNIEGNVEALNEGTFSYSKGLAYFAGDVGDGKYYTGWDGPEFRDMTEEEFRAQVEKHIEVFDAGKEKGAGGLCWWGKQAVKGSYYEDSRTGMEFPKDMTQPKIDASDGMYHTGELDEKTTFKYVPTFESFIGSQKLNEAKVKFGKIDVRNTKDNWKLEELNDVLKGAIGKKCTYLDIVNIAGHQSGIYDESTTKNTPKNVLKKINVEILDVMLGGSYDSMAHQIFFKYDAAPYDGHEYETNGKADLTGEVAKYSKNHAKDENGDLNGAGVKFKDFPKIYPDCAAVTTAYGFGSQKGFSSGSFLMYAKPDAAKMWSMFADVFKLGDITPNF